uniref:Uncharacterized protein n=1 Tax=Ralstonia solanacearum TaxID=305 RepID=A0A0S4WZA8_RALSL|nr:protein of unknown function [Ralstonia solanacearum]
MAQPFGDFAGVSPRIEFRRYV